MAWPGGGGGEMRDEGDGSERQRGGQRWRREEVERVKSEEMERKEKRGSKGQPEERHYLGSSYDIQCLTNKMAAFFVLKKYTLMTE